MNFGRLLAAGKSLVSGNMNGRYQMHENFRLPQFISPKNPFAAEAAAEESTSQAVTLEGRVAVVSAVTPTQRVSAFLFWAGESSKRAALWCLDHNPFFGNWPTAVAGDAKIWEAAGARRAFARQGQGGARRPDAR